MKRPDIDEMQRRAVAREDFDAVCKYALALETDHRAMREALSLIEPNLAEWPGYENADGEEVGTRVLAVLEGLRIKETPADAGKEAADAND